MEDKTINQLYLEPTDALNNGDLYFIDLIHLNTWGYKSYEQTNGKDDHYTFLGKSDDSLINKSILAVVKCVGVNTVEEMLTGEKIMLLGDWTYGAQKYTVPGNLYHNDSLDFMTLKQKQENLKEISKKYPLIYNNAGPTTSIYKITNTAKNEYLKFSKEEIIDTINQAKVAAQIEYEDFIKKLDEESKKIDLDTLEEAYLDNELYDFKNKSVK